jgi:hypothetical protein
MIVTISVANRRNTRQRPWSAYVQDVADAIGDAAIVTRATAHMVPDATSFTPDQPPESHMWTVDLFTADAPLLRVQLAEIATTHGQDLPGWAESTTITNGATR